MAKTILIMGESGSGKTTSMRNLDPATTYYFDCDKKGLSWKGWRNQYNTDAKNYLSSSDADQIAKCLKAIDARRDEIKVIIVDTLNGIMVDDEFNRMKEKGYDKWQDMAYSVYQLISIANSMRDDLTVIFIIHSQTERDDSGLTWTRAKTSGKKLDKITIESKFSTVLLAKAVGGNYVFETRSNNSTTKTPMGAFEEDSIPNDITEVLKALEEF
jgi:hypothetical protein